MAWSASHVSNLDTSMRAAKDVLLGTFLSQIQGLGAGAGYHVVTAAEDSASAVKIDANVSSISAWDVRIFTAGSYIATGDYTVTGLSGSVLTISSGSLTATTDVVIYNIY